MKSEKRWGERTQAIRELARKEGGQLFAHQIYGAFGATTPAEKKAVWEGMTALVKTGEAVAIGGRGVRLYEFRERPGAKPGPKRASMWAAIRNNRECFTVADIAAQAGTNYDYARLYIVGLLRDGHLKRVGYKQDGPARRAQYRLIRDQIEAPPNSAERAKGVRKAERRHERRVAALRAAKKKKENAA
jgi:hypothetical protein